MEPVPDYSAAQLQTQPGASRRQERAQSGPGLHLHSPHLTAIFSPTHSTIGSDIQMTNMLRTFDNTFSRYKQGTLNI